MDSQKATPAVDAETEEELIEKLKLDQDNLDSPKTQCHECELIAHSWDEDGDLHRTLVYCPKNPGHREFIPYNEFKIDDLPLSYRIPEMFEFLKVFADLTVQIKLKYASSDRPHSYPLSHGKELYPRYNGTNQLGLRFGTGWLRDVINYNEEVKEQENMTDETCPCLECINSPDPSKVWGELFIRTARHVCFDTSEAEKSICRFFYDDDKDKCKVEIVTGLKAGSADTRKDKVEMWCYTHDTQLAAKLEEMVERRRSLQKQVNEIYQSSLKSHRLVVIASHPHGCSKQITIGEWKNLTPVVMDYTEYQYTTQTCPGSSGAPVFVLGRH